MFANAAHTLRLVTTNYFEPINEGVIDVQAWRWASLGEGRPALTAPCLGWTKRGTVQ